VEELKYKPDGTIEFIRQTAGPVANPSAACKAS